MIHLIKLILYKFFHGINKTVPKTMLNLQLCQTQCKKLLPNFVTKGYGKNCVKLKMLPKMKTNRSIKPCNLNP